MRILLANKYAKVTGGADVHSRILAKALADRGHDVAFLSADPANELADTYCSIGTNVSHGSRDSLRGADAARVATAAIWNRKAARATYELATQFRPDVLHAHKLYPQLSVSPIVEACRLGIPVVQTLHDYEFVSASATDHSRRRLDHDESKRSFRTLNTALFQVKRRLHVPRVTVWIAVSDALAQAYEAGGIDTLTIPNFITGSDKSLPRFDQRRGILFVGRLTTEKGVLHVIELARTSPELPVLIAGSGEHEAVVSEAASKLDNLTFLGSLDSTLVRQQMEKARVLIMPSLWQDPGPLTVLEGMASGTPAVAYPNGGLAEYLRNANSGFIADPDLDSLRLAATRLHEDPTIWSEMSESGRRASQEIHSPEAYLDALEEVYAGCSD